MGRTHVKHAIAWRTLTKCPERTASIVPTAAIAETANDSFLFLLKVKRKWFSYRVDRNPRLIRPVLTPQVMSPSPRLRLATYCMNRNSPYYQALFPSSLMKTSLSYLCRKGHCTITRLWSSHPCPQERLQSILLVTPCYIIDSLPLIFPANQHTLPSC